MAKTELLQIVVTAEEKQQICRGARLHGERMSPWARQVLLFEAGVAETEHRLSLNRYEKLKSA
jgi:hypothetical protein